MLQAVIFDLDGTLIDSESLLEEVNIRLCAKYGGHYDSRVFRVKAMAHPDPEYTRILKDMCGLPGDVDAYVRERQEILVQVQDEKGLYPMPGAVTFMEDVRRRGMRMAVATSSRQPSVDRILVRLGWTSQFDAVICATDAMCGKPAPDIYLAAARAIDCDPASCLAIDDAPDGVRSAKAAGMRVIGLRDRRYTDDLPDADCMVDSFEEMLASYACADFL